MKKGQFTITFFILGFLILMLATFLLGFIQTTSKRVVEIGSLDRINTLGSSIEIAGKQIFNNQSNITIYYSGSNSITINESIPNDIISFNQSMKNFKIFLEKSITGVTLNITTLETTLPLLIYPNLILYNHDFSSKKIQIIPQELNLLQYNVTIKVPYDISCVQALNTIPALFEFELRVQGTSTSCFITTKIDPTNITLINISSGGTRKVELKFDNPEYLQIRNFGNEQINVSAKIVMN